MAFEEESLLRNFPTTPPETILTVGDAIKPEKNRADGLTVWRDLWRLREPMYADPPAAAANFLSGPRLRRPR